MGKKSTAGLARAYSLVSVFLLLTTAAPRPADAADGFFDELRFGPAVSVSSSEDKEEGVAASLTLFFDPLGRANAASLAESLLRPRVHLGASAGTEDMASQIYAGLSWTFDINDRIFLELGGGGLLHDGRLNDTGGDGPSLGCRALFREYAATGYRLTEHWNVTAQLEHASHANLCDGPNDGFSRASLLVGYRF